ncbi:MAG: PASTA domain-containing protein [Bacteroidales bacterium]|nr:PASTA domain-containing protein [Bacteroidales bacterium]
MNSEKSSNIIRKIYRFIVHHILIRNIILACLIVPAGTLLIILSLKLYTRHSEELTVPDLSRMTLEGARAKATSEQLQIVVFDSVFLTDFDPGTVVDHYPKPGLKVKRHRKIFLTMNAMNPERVPMPDLVSLTFRQAKARLESFSLKLGEVTYEPDIGINLVLRQKLHGKEIQPGDSVSKGSYINLVLGKGLSDELSLIPVLTGLRLEEAKTKAADRYLRIGGILDDNTIENEEDRTNAWIYQQRPEAAPESMLPMGSSIDVWITMDSTKIPAKDTLTIKTDEEKALLD